jgi:prepilin-type N-terminal cleavage/methylation domain-containing protein
MNVRRARQRGVTLIEVLIAVSLLSLLSVAIMMALRVGLGAMDRANSRLLDNRKMAATQRILEQQIVNFVPVLAQCVDAPDAPPERLPFFQGELQSMRFVSAYSLQEGLRGYPRVLEYQVIPRERGDGFRLVVNEHLYSGPLSAGRFCIGRRDDGSGVPVPLFRPILIGANSFVLVDELAACRFSFLERMPAPEPDRWVARWVGPRWPAAIRIEMAPVEANAARIPPVTLIAPVEVNALPVLNYADVTQ